MKIEIYKRNNLSGWFRKKTTFSWRVWRQIFSKGILNFKQIENKFLKFETFDINKFFKEI